MYVYFPLHETKAVTIPSIDKDGKLAYFYMTCTEVHEGIATLPNFAYCPDLVKSGSDSLLNSLHQNFSSLNPMEALTEENENVDINEENEEVSNHKEAVLNENGESFGEIDHGK